MATRRGKETKEVDQKLYKHYRIFQSGVYEKYLLEKSGQTLDTLEEQLRVSGELIIRAGTGIAKEVVRGIEVD